MIMQWEGCVLKAYKCPAGVLTIGYGHTGSDVKEGMTITAAQAVALFNQDIDKFSTTVEKQLGSALGKLTQNQFDALVSLSYNIGPGNFAKSSVPWLIFTTTDTPASLILLSI